jgi:hypothetical protein
MRISLATKLLSIAMMVLTPAAMLMAETGNTMLYASGNVMLNGKEVARSASVATGDKIETAGAPATAVSQDGSKVTVSPYSAVKYESSGVSVVKGAAAINTSDGMAAQAAQITVTPKDKSATYEIARVDNNVVVTSKAGALLITDAGATTELEAGASSSRPAEPTPAAAPAPAPQAAPSFPGSSLTRTQAWLIAAVVGGASAACGLLCGMSAAQQEPANGHAVTGAQARGMNRVLSVAHAVAVNSAAAAVAAPAQHTVAARSGQHRNIRAGR